MDAYRSSTALAKLREARQSGQPMKLALLDLDGTWAGPAREQEAVHQLLEKNHYVIGQVTSRSEGFLNPDILISDSGTQLALKQADTTYTLDETYAERLPSSPKEWHAEVDTLLSQSGIEANFYTAERVSLAHPRVEIFLATKEAAAHMIAALQALDSHSTFKFARETKNFFITPANTSKKDGVDHVTTALLQHLHASPADLSLLLAGDTAIEVPMGWEGAAGTQATFLIPGGAPLYEELRAGIFPQLSREMTKAPNSDTLPAGVYWFPDTNRNIVIGDEAFPGTIGPQTLIAWLQKDS